ncbi:MULTISPECIES: fumarylacetoacetase [unclassified Achromobacter]|uniref:fumarylacetoacetase n=1 Tax=unclassified Achromobacter TaxID=2626865 RepID=UPI000B51AEF7|nr:MULTISPECIES: fumarylacetoacetase [unclassified Achromobacter]OWT76904.1 fumarylacetoacetase [Achromobacter sp. HZ28]OWT77784.1 fumarylacetoacetase [Achromobacter sp. HZ34]
MILNETHDGSIGTWVSSGNSADTDFPLQNLPLGVYSQDDGRTRRVGVAIGDMILDLAATADRGLLTRSPAGVASAQAALDRALRAPTLNELMALGRGAASALRRSLFDLLRGGSPHQAVLQECLVPIAAVAMQLPARIGDFTDFYTSLHHASRAARAMRPGGELAANFRHLPIAYHGRASSIVISGTPCSRPHGLLGPDPAGARYLPSQALDFELEVGAYVGSGNALAAPVSLDDAETHLFGVSLVNDWSARDIQRWEAQPLGPFLSKSFMTSVSPWVVTLDALEPFRLAPPTRKEDEPRISPALTSPGHAARGALRIGLQAGLETAVMRQLGQSPEVISRPDFADQYWTLAQMLTHHTSNGCNLQPGDLLSSGTVSGREIADAGCLLERTRNGAEPLRLANGETRSYLQDGDRLVYRGRCEHPGFAGIGFGVCEARIVSRE